MASADDKGRKASIIAGRDSGDKTVDHIQRALRAQRESDSAACCLCATGDMPIAHGLDIHP